MVVTDDGMAAKKHTLLTTAVGVQRERRMAVGDIALGAAALRLLDLGWWLL
jgi:hypothetical protein